MGKSIALVKCKSDNSIYIGVYNGTSDTLERYFKPIDKYESFEKLIEEIKISLEKKENILPIKFGFEELENNPDILI